MLDKVLLCTSISYWKSLRRQFTDITCFAPSLCLSYYVAQHLDTYRLCLNYACRQQQLSWHMLDIYNCKSVYKMFLLSLTLLKTFHSSSIMKTNSLHRAIKALKILQNVSRAISSSRYEIHTPKTDRPKIKSKEDSSTPRAVLLLHNWSIASKTENYNFCSLWHYTDCRGLYPAQVNHTWIVTETKPQPMSRKLPLFVFAWQQFSSPQKYKFIFCALQIEGWISPCNTCSFFIQDPRQNQH